MNERRPTRFQVTVGGFLLSTALLGAGIGCLLAAFTSSGPASPWGAALAILQFLGGGALIGAALLTPLRRTRLGAYLGFFSGVIAGIAYAMVWAGWDAVWDLRYVIAFTLMGLVLGCASILPKVSTRRVRRNHWSEITSSLDAPGRA